MKKLLPLLIVVFLPLVLSAQRSLYDAQSIGEIRINLPVANWTELLDSLRIYGDGMTSASVVIDGARYENAGVRYRGNNSYQTGLKRNPFQIKLDWKDAGRQHQGHANIKLSSALRDPSMTREMLFYEIAGKYMPAPRAAYTRLYVNEEYIGVFINVESVDGPFLKKHYGEAGGALYKAGVDYKKASPSVCKQNIFGALEYEDESACYKGNFEAGASAKWTDLQQLTRVLNRDVKSIEKVLDVDQTLWMLALNNVMVNLSSYSGAQSVNYYLYADVNGRFHPVHWDLNLAFGSFKNTGVGSDLELNELRSLDPLLHADNPYKPLISRLLADPFYKKIYLSHMRQIVNENFKNGTYEKRAQELQNLITAAFIDDRNKLYSLEEFQAGLKSTVGKRSKIPGIVELMSERAKFLDDHADLTSLPSSVSEVTHQSRAKFEKERVQGFHISARADRFSKRMLIYYRMSANQPYDVAQMTEETGSLPTGVKKYAISIDAKNADAVLEYYIVVENAGAVSFSPAMYTTKPYTVKLSDLNK